MPDLSFTEAFKAYGAKLANPMWAYSAIAEDGALVLSCWSHKLKLNEGMLRYTDQLSRWKANTPGKRLLIEHLSQAKEANTPVRLVIAKTEQTDVVDRGDDASTIRKTFFVKPEVVGRVVHFDGEHFELEFRRA